jgi:hypothetical protein
MKVFFAAYWFFGCFVVGGSVASQDRRCPNDPSPAMVELLATVAIWPAAGFYGMFGGKPVPPCKVIAP